MDMNRVDWNGASMASFCSPQLFCKWVNVEWHFVYLGL